MLERGKFNWGTPMFTGIVQKKLQVIDFKSQSECIWCLVLPNDAVFAHVDVGGSVAVNGVCLTVVAHDSDQIYFDVMAETKRASNLGQLAAGHWVNIERAATFADEIGGHLVSGHVDTTVSVDKIERPDPNQWIVSLKTDAHWFRYIFAKGFVCLDGASLTIVDADPLTHAFSVHLIPETIARTRFEHYVIGDRVNLEVDQIIKATVDTVMRMQMN